jgi:hypothetical protein
MELKEKLVMAIASHYSVQPKAVYEIESLVKQIDYILTDKMASPFAIDLMATIVCNAHEAEMREQKEAEAKEIAKIREYWQNQIA